MTTSRSLMQNMAATLKLAYPLILAQVSQILLQMTDNLMVGQLGATALATVSFAGNVIAIPMFFGMGFSTSVATLSSRAHGSENVEEGARLLATGLWLNTLIGVVISGVLLALGPHLNIFGQPKEVIALAPSFYTLVAWSMIPMMMFQCLRQFSESMSKTFVPMLATITGLVINFVINYILVFGHFGAPAMGLTGSALATLISRISMCLVMIIYIATGSPFKAVRERFQILAISWSVAQRLTRVGLHAGSQMLFEVGAFASAGILAGWLGTTELASHQVALSICSMTFLVTIGIANAVSIRLGQQSGQGAVERIRETGLGGFVLVVSFMSLTALGMFLFRHQLSAIYVPDADVRTLAAQLMIVAAFFQVFDGAQVLAVSALRGLTDVQIPTLVTFVAYWVISLPVGGWLAFRFHWGATGIWVGLCLGLMLASLFLNARLWHITHPHRLRPQ